MNRKALWVNAILNVKIIMFIKEEIGWAHRRTEWRQRPGFQSLCCLCCVPRKLPEAPGPWALLQDMCLNFQILQLLEAQSLGQRKSICTFGSYHKIVFSECGTSLSHPITWTSVCWCWSCHNFSNLVDQKKNHFNQILFVFPFLKKIDHYLICSWLTLPQ